MKYSVEFENREGNTIPCGIANDEQEAKRIMFDFLRNKGFKVYYIRSVNHQDRVWVDFGSHTEFFHFIKIDE